ncbi:MAG: glycosyltransferase family 39 protein [Armatimonadetes bacterium]|nr:glycosyltransferase family 39 protein [Armatimonadota bacterium]
MAARNIAEGKGLGSPLIAGLVPGAERRSYVPVVVAKGAFSLWGMLFGFDLETLRWFNRLLGVSVLCLIFWLGLRAGLSPYLSLLGCLWISLDTFFQITANIARFDMISLTFTLLAVHCHLFAEDKKGLWWYFLSGLMVTLALFSHALLGLFPTLFLSARLMVQRKIREFGVWILPLMVSAGIWLALALDDWFAFTSQQQALLRTMTPGSWISPFASFLGFRLIRSDFMPTNSPPWLAVVAVAFLAWKKGHLLPFFWPAGLPIFCYFLFAFRTHEWYWGWFTPLGYFLFIFFVDRLIKSGQKTVPVFVLLSAAALWTGYQLFRTGQYLRDVRFISYAHQQFLEDLSYLLPNNATILSFARPDPYFYLQAKRPDVRVYQWPHSGISEDRLRRFLQKVDGTVMVEPVFNTFIAPFFGPFQTQKRWLLRSAPRAYQPTIYVTRHKNN